MTNEKFCVKCGKKFVATGREVICPDCKAHAAEDAKRAAVLKAKRASWAGESVPVRISGRSSTVIRAYGAANGLPFAAALDDLLKASSFFQTLDKKWEDITPYKSHRRDKATSTTENTQDGTQEAPQAAGKQEVPQDGTQATQAAKKAVKTSRAAAGKAAGKKEGRA